MTAINGFPAQILTTCLALPNASNRTHGAAEATQCRAPAAERTDGVPTGMQARPGLQAPWFCHTRLR
jgi:hypothetical protein